MTFTPLIPASGQSLGNSRTQVLNNFASLRTTLSNVLQPNHIDVNSSGAGKHIFLQMPVKTSGANNLTVSGEFGMIAQAVSGVSELFASRDGGTYFQLSSGTPVVGLSGTTFLPGGILLKWGSIVNVNGSVAVTYTTPFPTTGFFVIASIRKSNSGITISAFNTTGAAGFNVVTSALTDVSWIAIGN